MNISMFTRGELTDEDEIREAREVLDGAQSASAGGEALGHFVRQCLGKEPLEQVEQ